MSLPVLSVAVDFMNDGTWTDISSYLQRVEIRRGSTRVESPIVRYEAGTCVLTLDNSDRRFDPTNLTGPYTIPADTPSSGVQQARCNRTLLSGHGYTVAVPSTDPDTAEAVLVATTQGTGEGTSFTCARPTGATTGDILVAFQAGDWGYASQMTTPSGGGTWQLLASRDNGAYDLHTKIWWKEISGAEPSSYTFFQGDQSGGIVFIAAVRNASGTTPVAAATVNNGTAFFDTPAITPTSAADYEFRFVAGSFPEATGTTWDWTNTSGYTELHDVQVGWFTSASLASKSLSGLVSSDGGTLVKPMRPVRVRAIWDAPGTSPNLVDNPSVETNTTGWASNPETTVTRSNEQAYDGSWSLKLVRNGSNLLNVHLVECQGISGNAGTAGKHVYVSAMVYVPSAAWQYFNGFALNAGSGFPPTFTANPPGPDQWFRIELATILEADVDDVQIQFWMDGSTPNGTTIGYVDDVHVEISEHDLFTGYVDSWDIEWTGPNSSVVTVPCTDAFKIFSNYDRVGGSAVGSAENSGARINRILNGIGWPAGKRKIDTGDVALQSTTLEGNALEEMQLVADTEVGELYVDGSGNVVYRRRSAITTDTRSTDSNALFGDGGGSELPYQDLKFVNDDTQFANRVIITREGSSTPQVADDPASQQEFLVKTFERSGLIMTDDTAALNYAQYILSLSAQPELRFTDLEIMPQHDEERLFPQVLNRLIGDRITVRRRPPGGGDMVEQDCFIRGIEHEIEPGRWVTRWVLQSTAKGGGFFIIGHPTMGRLDNNPLGF